MRVVPVVFRKYVFSLCNVENDRSLVHVVTGRVNKMVINVNMFGKNIRTAFLDAVQRICCFFRYVQTRKFSVP